MSVRSLPSTLLSKKGYSISSSSASVTLANFSGTVTFLLLLANVEFPIWCNSLRFRSGLVGRTTKSYKSGIKQSFNRERVGNTKQQKLLFVAKRPVDHTPTAYARSSPHPGLWQFHPHLMTAPSLILYWLQKVSGCSRAAF